jgi:methyl-accepting chemotaxis protein
MTAMLAAAGAETDEVVADWLSAMTERRDLTLSPPMHPQVPAISSLLAALSAESIACDELAGEAREAARSIAADVTALRRSSDDWAGRSKAIGSAAAEARALVEGHVEVGKALQSIAATFSVSIAELYERVAQIGAGLRGCADVLTASAVPLGNVRSSTAGLDEFTAILARLSRHSQLLGVNASIEAAHLGEMGSRFAIVAQELRELSSSTRSSRADVAQTAKALRDSAAQIVAALAQSQTAVGSAASMAQTAASEMGSLSDLPEFIGELDGIVAGIAEQRRALGALAEALAAWAAGPRLHAGDAVPLADDRSVADSGPGQSWRVLRDAPAVRIGASDSLGSWIAALRTSAPVPAPTDTGPLVGGVRALVAKFDTDARLKIAAVRRAVANGAQQRAAGIALASSVEHCADGESAARADVGSMLARGQQVAEHMAALSAIGLRARTNFGRMIQLLDVVFGVISPVTENFASMVGALESVNGATARADEIVTLIETLSADTDLLSLNAAIEAAHAGELGLGFGVIAEETRSLARSTNDSTTGVSRRVIEIGGLAGDLKRSIDAAHAVFAQALAQTESARETTATMGAAFEKASATEHKMSTAGPDELAAFEILMRACAAADGDGRNALASIERAGAPLESIDARAADLARRGGPELRLLQ